MKILLIRTMMAARTVRSRNCVVSSLPLLSSSSPILSGRCLSTRPDRSTKANVDTASTSSLLHSAADFFGSLRWKAATALTASLPIDDRRKLWQRLDSVNQFGNQLHEQSNAHVVASTEAPVLTSAEIKNSIAEAVAAARAEESRRHAEKWEREKEALMKEAEQAATARVESDLAIQKRRLAFEQWKEQVEVEKNNREGKEETTPLVKTNPGAADIEVSLPVPEKSKTMDVAALEEPHPILGACLLDLGHKRVHVVSATALAAIPVWKEQRIYRHDRAKIMATDKQKTMHLGMPGVIGLYEDTNGRLSILDGQHRVGMLTILSSKQKDTHGILDRILVEVYPQLDHNDESHAQEIFLEINKAEPIKLVDMPGIAKVGDRKILTDATESLYEKYQDMFSASQKCRPPHLNRDNLRDALFAANVISRHDIKTARQLEEWMMQQNEQLAVLYTTDPKMHANVSDSALNKSRKFHFYLGINSTWYFN